MLSRLSARSRARHLAAALGAVVLLVSGCSSESGGDETATDPAASSSDSPTPSAEPSEAATCEYPSDGAPPAAEVEPPSAEASTTGEVLVTAATSAGTLTATLDAGATPCTVHSFLSLAEQGYFDGTDCHRLTTDGIYVLQCGDPTGTGAGGPGYSFPDELTGEETYPAGTLAMANAGPDTNGSQFFIVYEDTELPPSYTVFGQLDDGSVEVVQKVAAKGTQDGGPDGPPRKRVTIESITTG